VKKKKRGRRRAGFRWKLGRRSFWNWTRELDEGQF
jgi:hypothetical protein